MEAHRVEVVLVQRLASLAETLDMRVPGCDRVGLVEANRVLDVLPETLEVGLTEDRLRPALVRVADDRPVDPAPHDVAEVRLGELDLARLADTSLVEVAHELRLRVARDRDQRALLLAEVVEPLDRPLRRPLEHVVRALGDHRAPHVLVDVGHVDIAGAVAVGHVGDLAHERRVLDQAEDEQVLAVADVGADLHCKLC